jgi:hypothetical protein
MELTLERRYKKPTYTIGILFVNGKRFSETVEDKDRSLSADMPVEVIKHGKVYGLTAIPTGRYKIDMNTVSPKFRNKSWAKKYGGIVPRLLNVPCWSGVLIHPLNYASESEGCVGVGENKVKGGVIKSVEYFCKLMDEHLLPAKNRGEQIWITVK